MATSSLSAALTQEHHEIDRLIRTFVAAAPGRLDAAPIGQALALLRRHIYLEETGLFPPLRAGRLMPAIFAMLRGHGDIWQAMSDIEAALARADAAAAHAAAGQLLALLASHNQTEEPVIYAEADGKLPAESRASILEALGRAGMPEGWRCAKAPAA